MTPTDIHNEAQKLLRQYRNIPSLDTAKDVLVAKYGERDFTVIRSAAVQLWIELHREPEGSVPVSVSVSQQVPKKKSKGDVKKQKSSSDKKKKSIVINSRPASPPLVFGTYRIETNVLNDERIAEQLLMHFGTPAVIRAYQPYIRSVLSPARTESLFEIVDKLAVARGDYYEYSAATTKAEQAKQADDFRTKVRVQNALRAQRKKHKEPPKGENYFKIIYIPMGNKR